MLKKSLLVKSYIIILIIIVTGILIIKFNLHEKISIASIQEYINSYGRFAAIIYIVLFILKTLLIFFPSSVMVFLGGSLFGEVRGFFISLFCIFITASLAFFIGRYAGKDFVNKILKGRMKKFGSKAEEHGFKLVFLMRLSVIFPFDIMNYAAGLSKIRYVDFILGTMLGIIPETFSITYISSNIGNPMSIKFKIAIILFIVTVAIPFFFNKRKSNKEITNPLNNND